MHAHTGTQFKNLNIAKTTNTKISGGVIDIILLNKHAFGNTHILISFPKAMINCPYKSYLAEAEAGFHITLQFGRAARGGREVKVAGIHTGWPHLIYNQKAESDGPALSLLSPFYSARTPNREHCCQPLGL